jgi:Ca2+-binding EF-hand superfamily protein
MARASDRTQGDKRERERERASTDTSIPCQDVDTFFALIDVDKSGTIDKEEFMSFISDVETMSK